VRVGFSGTNGMTPRRWWTTVLLPVLALVLIGGTLALLRTSAFSDGGALVAGDLNLTAGALAWECPDQSASGDATDLAGFLIAPGETLILRQPVTVDATGVHLVVALGVDLPGLPAGTVASWYLEDTDGTVVGAGNVPLDQTVLLPDLGLHDHVVVVTLTLPAGDVAWVDPTADPAAPALNLGSLTVTAQQVRCGDGFAVACPGTPGVSDE